MCFHIFTAMRYIMQHHGMMLFGYHKNKTEGFSFSNADFTGTETAVVVLVINHAELSGRHAVNGLF